MAGEEQASLAARLMERFPERWHEQLTKKGNAITFVSWHHYADQLDELVGPMNWWTEPPVTTVTPERVIIAVGLTLRNFGTKWNVGDELLSKDTFGTASTNAFAQAFKRAAAMWGLGRYMYEKDEVYDTKIPETGYERRTHGDEESFQPATRKQKELIFKMFQSHVFSDAERGEYIAVMKEHGTTKVASDVIDDIQKKITTRKAVEAQELADLNAEANALQGEEQDG
jgi:hypothetical protein